MSSNDKSPGKESNPKEKKRSKKNRSRSRELRKREVSREKKRRKHSRTRSISRSSPKVERQRPKRSRWSSVLEEPIDTNILKTDILSSNNDLITISEKLKQINPILGLTSPSAQNWTTNVNPNILHTLNDTSKIKRKIFIPKMEGVNFVGLLLGPKGCYQKRLEQQSGCKILIRGKGTQKDGVPQQPDDDEEQHALIVGETEEHVNKAQYLIEKVLFADNETRNKIKEEQLKASQEMRSEQFFNSDINGKVLPHTIDDSLMTPYGPPDKNARIIPVPNDCVGLIIGKNGETIRRLHRETSCKIQIAKKEIPNTEVRNVFIEGPQEKYEFARKLIEDIVAEQQRLKQNFSHLGEINPFPGPYENYKVLNRFVGLIIGKNGETVRNLHQKTGCFIFIPKDSKPGEDFRNIELSGKPESIVDCKKEMDSLIQVNSALSNQSLGVVFDQNKCGELSAGGKSTSPTISNESIKSFPMNNKNYTISSQTMSQILNPQTNTLVSTMPNIKPVMTPQPMFPIPFGYPVMGFGQNYVNNINFTQNFNNFNHFNNYHPAATFVAFNPYQQVYPMQHYNMMNNFVVPQQKAIFPYGQTLINPMMQNNKLPNTLTKENTVISTNIQTNLTTNTPQQNKNMQRTQNENNKIIDQCNMNETKQKVIEIEKKHLDNDSFIANPTLSYIYGGHLFNVDKKEK